jgi:uncharacterized protein
MSSLTNNHALSTGTPLAAWEVRFERFLAQELVVADAAHDPAHIRRVVANARHLAAIEGADLAVVLPAAWLHDCVAVAKDSPDRSRASRLAAAKAGAWLRESGYPAETIPAIEHAIAAHSFTANITPETLEAQVVQDADRLDSIGAIGIARCFTVGGVMGRPIYDEAEPFPTQRVPDDRRATVDHFYTKLFRLEATMQTPTGRAMAAHRTAVMHDFLRRLGSEIDGQS